MKKVIKFIVLLVIAIMATAITAAAEDVVLMDMNTPSSDLTIANVDTTQEYIYNYDSSRKIEMKNTAGNGAEIGSVYSVAKDLSGYSYFNMWVYSPKANGANFTIDVYNKVDDTNTRVARYTVPTDWQGWKLVTAPFESFNKETANEIDWSAVTKYRVTSYSTLAGWAAGDFLCIDKIWCSAEDPYAVEESELIIDYDNATASSNGSFATTNTRVSGKSLKHASGTDRKEAICTLNSAINITDYSYINMWVYLSEQPIRADKDDNPILRIRLYDGSVNAQTGSSCSAMKLNWQGWKLVTVQINDTNFSNITTLDKSKITAFKVVTNENNSSWNSFKDSVDIYFDKIWFSQEAPVAASLAITGVISANGDSNFRSLDSAIELNLGKNANIASDGAFTVTAKDSEETVSVTPYLIAPGKISLFLGEKLADNTEYTVKISADAIMDGDGFGNDETTFEFTTRPVEFKADVPAAYDYATKLAAGTATDRLKAVTKLYNTTDESKTVTLFVAVYGGDGALESIALKEHTVAAMSEVTVDTITKVGSDYTYATKEADDSVRCFIWESGSLTPVGLVD